MKRVIALCILFGAVLWAVDPWTGVLGPVPWWVKDNTSSQNYHKYRGICVINDSVAWVVGEDGQVWTRTDGLHDHEWIQVTIDVITQSSYHFNDVCFVDADKGWIVGEKKAEPDRYEGVVVWTTNGGTSWHLPTGMPPLPLPTPFLKVRFANAQVGYVSCGNGIVLFTTNGGNNWLRTTSDPWDDANNPSVWYGGLGLVDGNNLWVSGDAFGIISKSTDAGANWTAYQLDVFKQSYSFPSGTQTPHDPRLANFDMSFTSSSNGRVALSYGKIGKTTNSGSTWDTIRYEPQATWFYDVANDGINNFAGGNYGVVHRFDGTDEQEHVNYRWYDDPPIDFSAIDAGTEFSYGAGEDEVSIRQRYQPADFSFGDITVQNMPDSGYYKIIIRWDVNNPKNLKEWQIRRTANSYLFRGRYDQLAYLPDTAREYHSLLGYSAPKADYYYHIYVRTYDTYGLASYQQECGIVKIDVSLLDSLQQEPFPPAPGNVNAQDVPGDQGHKIGITWDTIPNGDKYCIGRATHPDGPYYWVGVMTHPTDTFTDVRCQNGINYYYVITVNYPFLWGNRKWSPYSNIDSVIPIDNLPPNIVQSLTGVYDQNSQTVKLEWSPPASTPDIAGYWVCPIAPGASDAILNHASPIEHTIFYVPVDSTWQGWCEFFVAAMDYSGNISDWGDPCSVYVVTTIDTSTSSQATAENFGRNMVRVSNTFWVCYESNGVVCVKKSSDNGKTWSNRMQLGDGYYPCISLNSVDQDNPPPGVAWLAQGTNDTIYFSKYVSGTSWSTPTAIVTSSNNLGPPSIAIGNDQYCYLTYKDGSIIKYTRFYMSFPFPHAPDSVGQGSRPSIGHMTSGSGYPEVHIAWESSSNIKYRAKTLSSGWSSTENIFANGKRPCLEVVGSVVHVVCDSCSTDIYHCKAQYNLFGHHSWTIRQVSNTKNNSKYAVITGGNACAWVEELSGNKEIYHSYYDAENGWSTPVNVSETSDHSNYPDITHKQTQSETKLYFVWTEGDNSPYDIKFKWSILGGGSRGGKEDDPDLPFYVANCGEERASGFNLRREGYIQYGEEPYERIDYDSEYLEYKFEMLQPKKEYALEAYLYHKGNNNLPLTIKVDNSQIAQISLPGNELVVRKDMLPSLLYNDGCVDLKIYGNNAVSGILVIYEYEDDKKGSGGPQTQEIVQLNKLLFDGIYPNPMKGNKNLKLAFNTLYARKVTIKLYDVTGRLMQEVYNGTMKKGQHEILVRTDEMAAGVYFMRVESENDIITEKFILLR